MMGMAQRMPQRPQMGPSPMTAGRPNPMAGFQGGGPSPVPPQPRSPWGPGGPSPVPAAPRGPGGQVPPWAQGGGGGYQPMAPPPQQWGGPQQPMPLGQVRGVGPQYGGGNWLPATASGPPPPGWQQHNNVQGIQVDPRSLNNGPASTPGSMGSMGGGAPAGSPWSPQQQAAHGGYPQAQWEQEEAQRQAAMKSYGYQAAPGNSDMAMVIPGGPADRGLQQVPPGARNPQAMFGGAGGGYGMPQMQGALGQMRGAMGGGPMQQMQGLENRYAQNQADVQGQMQQMRQRRFPGALGRGIMQAMAPPPPQMAPAGPNYAQRFASGWGG